MLKPTYIYFLFIIVLGCNSKNKENTDRFPEGASKENITVEGIDVSDPELNLSLFAAEPDLVNPTNMDIDHKGRVWICEAYNYRNDVNKVPYKKKGDRILILEDTNNDGKSDKTTVFYQGEDINSALGILVLGEKIIVSCSPNVLVFTDTNQDDVPDSKEILFKSTGGYQNDHGLHSFVFGPDGYLYFNMGNLGGGIVDKNDQPLKDKYGRIIENSRNPFQDGMALKCNLEATEFEVIGWNFRNNYELALDAFGRIWQSDNDDDGNRGNRINYVMRNGNFGYKDEKTGADWRVARTNLEDSVYLQHWHQNDPGVIPNLHQTLAGSPTGILIYEGNALPEKYNGRLFLADAGTNELNSYEISPNGAGYQLKKFNVLDASQADKWFRPSDICVAPDGSLFVADWYDSGVGGHFIGDLDRGRIYKLSKTNHVTNLPKFDFTNPVSAVEALKSPNMATRYLAHKAILKNKSQAEAPLYNLWKNENPVLSVRALWLLADINKKYVEEGSKHLNPNIRATAVRIASQHKNTSEDFYVKMAQDPSITVREAVATAVYKKNFPKAWITLAQKYTSYDKWNLEALGIAAEGNWDSYLGKYLKELKGGWLKNPAALDIIWRSRALQTPQLLAEIIQNVPFEESKRYFRAFDFQNREASNSSLVELLKTNLKEETILLVFKHFDANTIKSNKDFQTILPQVLAKIKDDKDFLEIARKYELSEQKSRITKILNESQDKAIITEAANILTLFFGVAPFNEVLSKKPYSEEYIIKNIERIGLVDNEVVAKQLIQIFSNKKYSFKIREAAVLAMEGYQSDFKLWNLIKVNKLSKELLPAAKKVLSKTYRSDLKTEFEAKYGKPTEQIAVISNQLLQQKGNKTKGKEIFEMYCTTCHVAEGIGNEFGPGLGQIGKKLTKESIYNAIIQPSQGISFGYEGHNITLEDGSTIQAIITSKTQEAYILKFPGQSNIVTYKKSQVKSVSEMTTSMMPAFNLPETEMVDLLEYLSQLK